MSRLFPFWLLFVLALTGCVAPSLERQAVEVLLNQRQQALSTKDLGRYQALLSRDYLDKGKDYATKTAELAALFTTFERIDARFFDRQIKLAGDCAIVTEQYTLRVTRQGKSFPYAGKEILTLRKEADGWKIVAGL